MTPLPAGWITLPAELDGIVRYGVPVECSDCGEFYHEPVQAPILALHTPEQVEAICADNPICPACEIGMQLHRIDEGGIIAYLVQRLMEARNAS